MKKEKNSEQEKLHCFINIYITKQAQIDQKIINVEGLFSGLRDIWIAVSVSFPLNDYKITRSKSKRDILKRNFWNK